MEKRHKKINFSDFSDLTGISKPHVHKILTGRIEPGKNAAKKIGRVIGYDYTDVLKLKPFQIRTLLEASIK